MAQTILIKRSTGTATPGSLTAGELAYSDASDKLFIGAPADAAVTTIGGKVFMDMLAHTAGTLAASSAIIVDSNSKIDQLLVDNMRIGTTANTIDTSSGTLTLAPAGNLVITHGGTVDLSAQANEITLLDNNAAALNITESSNSYLKFVTTNSAEKIIAGKTLIVDGDGTTGNGGISLSNGVIDLKNGGTASKILFYCESSNAHYAQLQAPAHSAFDGNKTLTLPAVTDTLAGIAATQTLTNKTLTTPTITTPVVNAGLQLKNGATSAGFLEFFEDSDNGTNKVTLIGPASTADITLTLPSSDGDASQALITDGSGVLSFSTAKLVGKETIYVPAAAMYPNTTNGCADIAQVELSNGPELKCLDFDPSSDENAQFTVCFPKSWNEGTVTFQAFWTVTGTNTGTVAWGLSGGSMADDASINTAFGTNVVATAKAFSGTSNDMTVSAESGAVTIANAAVDTMTYFQIMRDVSADDQSGDARLLGIKLFFTTDAANDA